jgi:hypothetical protein
MSGKTAKGAPLAAAALGSQRTGTEHAQLAGSLSRERSITAMTSSAAARIYALHGRTVWKIKDAVCHFLPFLSVTRLANSRNASWRVGFGGGCLAIHSSSAAISSGGTRIVIGMASTRGRPTGFFLGGIE